MGTINLLIPQVGQPNSSEDPKIATDLTTLQTLVNGNVDTNNLAASAGVKRTQLAQGASFPNRVVVKSGSYTAALGDFVIVDAASALTITLPTVAIGGMVCIWAGPGTSGTNVITIAASGGAQIYVPPGGFTPSSTLINVGTCWLMLSDGTNWIIALSTPGGATGPGGPPH